MNQNESPQTVDAVGALEGVDAVVVASFGGPEGMEDVRPFLENVTRGRGIPPERLDEVGEHYSHFDGISPLNELNRQIIRNVEAELAARGHQLPVYFANRNWHPLFADTVERMAQDGIHHALVFATSAWAGYSGCRQYDEDITAAREEVTRRGYTPPTLTKIRQFYDHPLFIAAETEAVRRALARIPEDRRDQCRVVFTAHSIPLADDKRSGTEADGENLYSRQIREAAALVATKLGLAEGDYDTVWQSRSGPPHIPWLEPDIVDHIADLHKRGVRAAVVSPIGFISDHVEVAWDLDTELAEESKEFDMAIERAETVGHTQLFTTMVVDLIEEYCAGKEPLRTGHEPLHGCTTNGAPCALDCCQPPKRHPH